MSIRPLRAWGHAGTLLDALKATRRDVAAVNFPYRSDTATKAQTFAEKIVDQLDRHLIPRALEASAPAVVVVGGSTGAGKSALVNALVGETLTPAGVLRPTTMVPHLFHNPLDSDLLSTAAKRAVLHPHHSIPRGLTLVDSPDLDSLVGENREMARELLDAADLWVFVTTAARYGDSVPWEILRQGAERGASIAIVLNRVTADVAAQVRRDLVERLRREGLESLPLFVIPEQAQGLAELPADVVESINRWLASIAKASATTVVERTLGGAFEAVKEWLEQLAELMDERAVVVKDTRAAIRKAAAHVEQEGGDYWFSEIAAGPVTTLWGTAAGPKGPLFRIHGSSRGKRKPVQDQRMAALAGIREALTASVQESLEFAVSQAFDRMLSTLGADDDGPGAWLISARDPDSAADDRSRHAREATLGWLVHCESLAQAHPGAARAVDVIGKDGLVTTFASAALGVSEARQVLALVLGSGLTETFEQARGFLTNARRHAINREALAVIGPSDLPSLAPDDSAVIRLRRAELRSLM